MFSWSKLLTTSVLMLFLLNFSIPSINASSDDLVTVSLTEAEELLALSYEAILDAEQAGANVSALFERFNVGCEYLSKAHIWHRLGNHENTSYFAGLCYDLAEDVQSDASELRDEAKTLADADFVATAFGSIVGIIAIIVSSFFVWRIFKHRYYKRILGLKPEVVLDES